jgi:hypothetical protein
MLLRSGLEGTRQKVFQDGLLSTVIGMKRSKLKNGKKTNVDSPNPRQKVAKKLGSFVDIMYNFVKSLQLSLGLQ